MTSQQFLTETVVPLLNSMGSDDKLNFPFQEDGFLQCIGSDNLEKLDIRGVSADSVSTGSNGFIRVIYEGIKITMAEFQDFLNTYASIYQYTKNLEDNGHCKFLVYTLSK